MRHTVGGAQIVVVTVNSGLDEPSSYDTVATKLPSENVAARVAREVPGIALVLYGHSHKENAGVDIGPTRMLQAKNWAQIAPRQTRIAVSLGLAAPASEVPPHPATARYREPRAVG